MRRWKAWALAWLLAAIVPALLLQAPSARGHELLANGGFEDGVAAPWMAWSGGLNVAAGLGRNGSVAGVFSTDDSHYYHWVGQCVSTSGGVDYQFSGWIAWPDQGESPSAHLRISWYSQADCFGDEVHPADDSATIPLVDPGYWYYLTLETDTAVATARSARVSIVLFESNATVYLDDFSFTGSPAPTPTPTPTPSPTPPPTQTPSPTASPSPSPEPTASPTPLPTASPSPTTVPTATKVPSTATPPLSTPTPPAGLVNGGFEEADDEGRPLAWRKYGGELRRSAAASRDGRFAAAFTSRTASTKWAFQAVAVEGGEAYALSGYALKNDANVEAAYLRLSWYASPDGSGRAIDSVDSMTRLTDDSPDFRFLSSGPVVAPAEAASAKVRLMFDPLSETEATVYFDAISFGETTMPPQPVETPQPSPTVASRESPTASAVVPAASPEQPKPSPSPDPPRPSPTVLGATQGSPEATASSRDGPSQSEPSPEGTSPRTPAVLYRERRAAQSTQGAEGIVAEADEDDGLSPIVLILATALPAVVALGAASWIWQRWQKRARPP